MANFLPHELTNKKKNFIIDARKLLVYVSHNYKNLVFGDNYFHNSFMEYQNFFLKISLKEKYLFPGSKASSKIRWASRLFPS